MGACVLEKLKWVGNEEEENSHWGLLQWWWRKDKGRSLHHSCFWVVTTPISERQGPDLTQERNEKQKLGLRDWTHTICETAVEREVGRETFMRWKLEKKAMPVAKWLSVLCSQVTGRGVYESSRKQSRTLKVNCILMDFHWNIQLWLFIHLPGKVL